MLQIVTSILMVLIASQAGGGQNDRMPDSSFARAQRSAPTPPIAPGADDAPAAVSAQRATEQGNRSPQHRIRVSGEWRMRFEGRIDEQFRSGNSDSYFLTRLRLDMDVVPTAWLRLFLQGQDAQAMGLKADPDPPLVEDTFDLRQAYVDIFHRERQGFGLRVGRQEFIFGDERLIGAFNWGNTARTFDAVRLFYARPTYRVDLFASSVVVIEDGVFDKHRDGANLYGVYSSFPRVIPRTTFEGYVLWRTLPRVVGETGVIGDADVFTVGTRWVGTVPAGFDYRLELAGQSGRFAGDCVRAWALHTQLGYSLARPRTHPRILVEYNYASGDRDPLDGRRETFDQLFPTNHDKYGIADLIGWRNMHNWRTGVGFKLSDRITARGDYHSFWLASRRDALYAAGGAPVARIPAGARSRHVGQEIDLDFRVTLSRSFSLWAGYAYLFAGDFLRQATPGANTAFYYTMLIYRF